MYQKKGGAGGRRPGAGNVPKPDDEKKLTTVTIKVSSVIDKEKLKIYNYRAIYYKDIIYVLLRERPDMTVDELANLTGKLIRSVENFCKKLGIVIKEDRTTEIPPINPKDIFIEEEW